MYDEKIITNKFNIWSNIGLNISEKIQMPINTTLHR